jgi:hypothetical protein
MGLYLKQSNDNKYFRLTCQHCVLDTDNEAYSYANRSQPALTIIQPGHKAFKERDEQCKLDFEWWSGQGEHQEGKAEEIQAFNDTKDILSRFRSLNHRAIGYVFSSPPRALHRSDGWLRDWALIELDVEKFGEDLTNIVYISEVPESTHRELEQYRPYFYFKMGGNKSLKLEGRIPEDDMKHPKMTDMNDEPCLIVAKRGHTTGVTRGRANEVKSVRRTDPKVTRDGSGQQVRCNFGMTAISARRREHLLAVIYQTPSHMHISHRPSHRRVSPIGHLIGLFLIGASLTGASPHRRVSHRGHLIGGYLIGASLIGVLLTEAIPQACLS